PRRHDAKLPEGDVQATRTYLELKHPGQFRPAVDHFPELTVEPVARPTPELYRECYRSVGAAYHWRDRWDWTDQDIRAHLAQPEITLHVARRRGALAGWYELRRVPEDGSEYPGRSRDRKSTRLNSSHVEISYAVFCLKKKK